MAQATTVKAFVCIKKMMRRLIYCCASFLMMQLMSLDEALRRLMSAEPVWLNERFFKEAGQRTVRKRWKQTGEGEKRERTI